MCWSKSWIHIFLDKISPSLCLKMSVKLLLLSLLLWHSNDDRHIYTVIQYFGQWTDNDWFCRRQHHFESNQRNCNTTGLLMHLWSCLKLTRSFVNLHSLCRKWNYSAIYIMDTSCILIQSDWYIWVCVMSSCLWLICINFAHFVSLYLQW